jgi:chorismate mutase
MHAKTMELSERPVSDGAEPLMSLREQIDQADHYLITALATRLRLAEEVGTLKKYMGEHPRGHRSGRL